MPVVVAICLAFARSFLHNSIKIELAKQAELGNPIRPDIGKFDTRVGAMKTTGGINVVVGICAIHAAIVSGYRREASRHWSLYVVLAFWLLLSLVD